MAKDVIIQEITDARIRLMIVNPFYGALVIGLYPIDASKWCNTMATDGRHLYYNRDFVKLLSRDELIFVLAHEVLHVMCDHIGRNRNRNKEIQNMAADFVVNAILEHDKIGKPPKHALLDSSLIPHTMSTEDAYELLMERNEKIQMPLDMHLDGNPSGGSGNNKCEGDGSGGMMSIDVMGENGPPMLSEDDLLAIRNEMRGRVEMAMSANSAGHIPEGIKRIVDELLKPKIDWRAYIDSFVKSFIVSDYSYRKISPLYYTTGFIFPTLHGEEAIHVACSVDCSGSMTNEMLRDFLAEIKGILEAFSDFKLHLWTFDTQVYGYKVFTPDNMYEIDDYAMNGGGGTHFECNWQFMKQNDINPDRFIMFTDGYPGDSWGDPDYCDTLFVIHGNPNITSPFGLSVYYDPDM